MGKKPAVEETREGHPLFVRLPAELHARLDELCKTYGVNWSEAVRRMIEDALEAGWNPASSMTKRAERKAG